MDKYDIKSFHFVTNSCFALFIKTMRCKVRFTLTGNKKTERVIKENVRLSKSVAAYQNSVFEKLFLFSSFFFFSEGKNENVKKNNHLLDNGGG